MLAFLNLFMYIALFLWSAYTIYLYYRNPKSERPAGAAIQLWAVCLTSLYIMIHASVMVVFMFQCNFFKYAEPWYIFTGSYPDLQITWTMFLAPLLLMLIPIRRRLKE